MERFLNARLHKALRQCLPPLCDSQDPTAADKLAKIQKDLDETKIILHKTIESVLDRGEKLDQVGRDASMQFSLIVKMDKPTNEQTSEGFSVRAPLSI